MAEFDPWLTEHYPGPEDWLGKDGLSARLTKAAVERALGAELTHHLGHGRGGVPAATGDNCRNGNSATTVRGADGQVVLAVPRDRHGTFTPQLMAKGQRRFDGFDEQIIALSARGLTVREIQGLLWEQYPMAVGPDLIRTLLNFEL